MRIVKEPSLEVGTSRVFVVSKGLVQAGTYAALVGEDDSRRLFAELHADPDRPEVRPQEAYKAVLSSMQPGWTLRLLQIFWPDPEPRLEFERQVQTWGSPGMEGLDILHQGLMLAVQEHPLPFVRRTLLEFVLTGEEGMAWWAGLEGLCAGFGFKVGYLDLYAIERLTRWVLNPNLEYRGTTGPASESVNK
jgi:hypothetical protein